MSAVYRMLEEEFGIDFTHYKPSTVTRRIERRLQLSRVEDIGAYVDRLRKERAELDILYRDLLIGVTRFFRNEEAFLLLEQRVLPELLERETHAPFRVWVAGCATGEEVYSLAILLHELAPRFGDRPVKIFATDVHHGSLEHATRALYGEDAVANVSPERLERYFIRRGDKYQIVPDIRQMVVFAPHNVIKDAPFTRVDLISCRNLLIYLQPAAQQKALSFFHFALNRGGIVLLGPSESPGPMIRDFETVDKHWRIYRKYSDLRTQVDTRLQPPSRREHTGSHAQLSQGGGGPALARASMAHLLGTYDALLEERMPASLLLSDRGELVHSFGGASRFLKRRDGRLGGARARHGRRGPQDGARGGLARALKDAAPVVFKGVHIDDEGGPVEYRCTVQRVLARGSSVPHVLVSFEKTVADPARAPRPPTEIDLGQVSRDRLNAVEAELTYTKESLQAATEQLESSNEELQAANEELLASNEELQSTNEELQSVNEELYSVNAEYQRKIADLTEVTNDLENFLSSTDVGIIFLDRQLKIRKFTPAVAEMFNLLPQDVGRPIETFAKNIDHPELTDELRRVVARGEPVERELRDHLGRAFFLRLLPYREGDRRRRGTDGHRRDRPQAGRGCALPRTPPAEQPAADGPGRHLLQGRARPVHSRQPRDGAAARPGGRARGRGKERLRAPAARARARRAPAGRGRPADRRRRKTTGSRVAKKRTARTPGISSRASRSRTAMARSSGSSASSATSRSRSAPRRRSTTPFIGATTSSPCSLTSCAIRSGPS